MNILQGVTLTFRSIATMVCLISVGLTGLLEFVKAIDGRTATFESVSVMSFSPH